MNLKNAKKIVSAYKLACSDGVPPTTNFDWQPSPMGYKMADLMLACRVVGTSIEELQKESLPKKEEPKKVEPKKEVSKKEVSKKKPSFSAKSEPKKVSTPKAKEEPKKEEPKKEEPKKVELKEVISFGDKDGDGIPDYKDKDTKPKKSSRRKKSTTNKTEEK